MKRKSRLSKDEEEAVAVKRVIKNVERISKKKAEVAVMATSNHRKEKEKEKEQTKGRVRKEARKATKPMMN